MENQIESIESVAALGGEEPANCKETSLMKTHQIEKDPTATPRPGSNLTEAESDWLRALGKACEGVMLRVYVEREEYPREIRVEVAGYWGPIGDNFAEALEPVEGDDPSPEYVRLREEFDALRAKKRDLREEIDAINAQLKPLMPMLHRALGYPWGGPSKKQAIEDLERYRENAISVANMIDHFRRDLERGGGGDAEDFGSIAEKADSLHRNLRSLQDAAV